ncbi:SpoIIE family protein phosphatase [Pseudobacteriovorax antillogorgiicola]|uniref:histidine kinase n=1 Tax=Pseudobacteriovorax antillogorgiicola TaxID=1513793 RepID=A0A1Y6BSL0_9BACT|nr:SpoIIE family protein phosphatase [Pseudobacteriovorax antillogorgiicola]TCS54504.1 signal transduction histidine kinase [Pseudobacteriovorax antillogorgiicola]SMF19014.1 Signal transduction histidine kinase [Pseudobacteriovorax antillogorgiicola]
MAKLCKIVIGCLVMMAFQPAFAQVLDLSQVTWNKPIPVPTTWKFYDGHFEAEDINEVLKNFEQLEDKPFQRVSFFDPSLPHRAGWFFLKVIVSAFPEPMAINRFLANIPFEVYILPEITSKLPPASLIRGVPGLSPKDSHYQNHPGFAAIPKDIKESFFIAVKVSSPHGTRNLNFLETPQIQSLSSAEIENRNQRLQNFFLLGLVSLAFVYSLSLFWQRHEDRGSFWLACFAAAFLYRYLGTEHILPYIITHPPYWLSQSMAFARALGHALMLAAILHHSYYTIKGIPKKMIRISWIIVFALFLTALIAQHRLFTLFILSFLYCFFYGILLIYWVGKACYRREDEAFGLVFGITILFFTSLSDFLVFQNQYDSPYLFQFGILLFIVIQNQFVGQRFAKTFRKTETQALTLELMNHKLIEQERSRTLFFQNTSHELRTPLNGIIGFLSLIESGHYGSIPEKVREQVGKVHRLSNALMNQVNMILDLAKARRGKLDLKISQFSFEQLVKNTKTLAESLHSANKKVSYYIEHRNSGAATLKSDLNKIETIIRNLVGNAFKFTKQGKSNHIAIRLSRKKSVFIIEVKDQGIGIPPSEINRIFEEFQQVDGEARRSYEGTGLGLTMVKQLTESLGGTINVISQLNQGSTFRVELPIDHDSMTHEQLHSDQESQEPASSKPSQISDNHSLSHVIEEEFKRPLVNKDEFKIVVIDDNPINSEVIQDILENEGLHSTIYSSGATALENMAQDMPDLVLLDMMMPDISGEDILREMRSRPDLQHIPVILVTARASQEDLLFGLRLGADDYLSKPIISDEMVLRVKNTLTRVEFSKASTEKNLLEMALASAQSFQANDAHKTHKNFVVEHFYQSAEISGGDWFGHFLSDDENRIYLVIGDVTGHGMESAVLTVAAAGAVQSCISTIRHINQNLPKDKALEILAHAVNGSIINAGKHIQRAMTMALVSIDLETGAGCYLNAGHNSIIRISDQKGHSILEPGSPLGFYQNPEYGIRDFQLHHQDMLFLYTDGLLENKGPDGNRVKTRMLYRTICPNQNPKAVKQAVMDKTQSIWKSEQLSDDCSFLVFQWLDASKLDQTKRVS